MEENKNKKENLEQKQECNKKNNYIIPLVIVGIIAIIVVMSCVYMNMANKQKNNKQQSEKQLSSTNEKDNRHEGNKNKNNNTKPKETEKKPETKYLSKEEYLKIFKEYVGTDFPGIHTEKDPNGKKLEILEDVTEGLFDKCKYYLVKGNMIKSNNSGFAEGDYKVITRQQVRDRAHQFVRDMGYGKITEYRDNYDKSDPASPSDLKVDLTAHNRDEKELKLTIIFLRDKENKVADKVYAAYVGIK